ncbi:MAG TPA: hypothetical protein EYQ09_05440 [Flavobacteriales bacterium]|nr:hypothetical protein [Flavobacteriales bacterium]HIK62386.1 hypothetical protein [Flavobacteriales bacterium]
MNTTLKLLSAVTITVLLVSCGGNDKTNDAPKLENTLVKDSKITEILKKKSVIYGKAESFEFNSLEEEEVEKFNITMIVMSADMNCTADAILCEEISNFIGGKKLVFSSSEEYALIEEESPEYRMMQKGTIEINDNTYSGTLYYNGKGNNEVVSFHGRLIFELPAIKSLKGEPLIIEIKGKK